LCDQHVKVCHTTLTGVVPFSLGVLNLSFNMLKGLPTSLGSAPVLQQMYLANNEYVSGRDDWTLRIAAKLDA